jgi:hypothetical protein
MASLRLAYKFVYVNLMLTLFLCDDIEIKINSCYAKTHSASCYNIGKNSAVKMGTTVCTFPPPFLHNTVIPLALQVLHWGTKSTHKGKGLNLVLLYMMSMVIKIAATNTLSTAETANNLCNKLILYELF